MYKNMTGLWDHLQKNPYEEQEEEIEIVFRTRREIFLEQAINLLKTKDEFFLKNVCRSLEIAN